jgi:colicin import membrane protein
MAVAIQRSWFKEHWAYLLGAVLMHAFIAALFGITMLEFQRESPPPMLAIEATIVGPLQMPKPARPAPQRDLERERREAEAKAEAERQQQQQQEETVKREQEQRAEQERQATLQRQEQEREQEKQREEQVVRERETQERVAKEKAAEEQRAAELKKQAEAQRQKKLEAERQAKADAEKKRVAEIERKQREREEADRKRAAADAAAREKALQDQLAAEEANDQLRSSPAMSQYAAALQQHVERNWNRPPSTTSGLECVIAVSQSQTGAVLRVNVEQCNGDAAVRQSIENAVQRASPLPLPSDMRLFDRSLRFIFKPAG